VERIEKNVPMPEGRVSRATDYPFADMTVGDSIAYPIAERQRVANVIYQRYHKKGEKRFTVRIVSDSEIRVWRIR